MTEKNSPEILVPARTAILFAGPPRWCRFTDLQLAALNTQGIVDWYVTFWAENTQKDPLVNPNWAVETPQDALFRLGKNLPQGHRIQHCELLYPHILPPIPRANYSATQLLPPDIWRDYWCLQRCDQARQRSGIEYDLVIRSRPELAITQGKINLDLAARFLRKNPETLITARNLRLGPKKFSEHLVVARPSAMTDFTNSIDHWDRAYQGGVAYHPAHLLGALLESQGYQWPQTDFEITVLDPLRTERPAWGRWC
jgi:hypothetical protein